MVSICFKVFDDVSTGGVVNSHALKLLHRVLDYFRLGHVVNADCGTRVFSQLRVCRRIGDRLYLADDFLLLSLESLYAELAMAMCESTEAVSVPSLTTRTGCEGGTNSICAEKAVLVGEVWMSETFSPSTTKAGSITTRPPFKVQDISNIVMILVY